MTTRLTTANDQSVASVDTVIGNASPSATAVAFQDWTAERLDRIETALTDLLPAESEWPAPLHRGMRYAVLEGGKRIRPLLVYAAGEFAGAAPPALDLIGCAVELIHAYSLVHDDLPCMDNDSLRRGKPTVHIAFGEAQAMLVGDSLQALAFGALARVAGAAPNCGACVPKLVGELAFASGSRGMAGGQSIDLSAVGSRLTGAELEAMHRMKTGALLRASVLMGAAAAGPLPAPTGAALNQYADAIGLAFQVIDDLLDVEGDSTTLGKTAGKDAAQAKPTYVSLLGLAATRQLAERLRGQARSALQTLGPRAERLADLADVIVNRRH